MAAAQVSLSATLRALASEVRSLYSASPAFVGVSPRYGYIQQVPWVRKKSPSLPRVPFPGFLPLVSGLPHHVYRPLDFLRGETIITSRIASSPASLLSSLSPLFSFLLPPRFLCRAHASFLCANLRHAQFALFLTSSRQRERRNLPSRDPVAGARSSS